MKSPNSSKQSFGKELQKTIGNFTSKDGGLMDYTKIEETKPPLKDHTSLSKAVKRFAREVGQRPRYESILPFKEKVEERFLKAEREANEIKEKYQEFLEIKTNLILSIEKWILSYKYPKLDNLKQELEAILIDLK